MRALVLVVLLAGCTAADPLSPLPEQGGGVCLDAHGGEACTGDGWCESTDQCGADVRFCRCVAGRLQCTATYSGEELATCAAVPDALTSCQLEGTGVCDREPVGGGTCGCAAGHFVCHNACDGCPMQQPHDGDACATTDACRYGITCTCVTGRFQCGA
jgi:hypothetical protein